MIKNVISIISEINFIKLFILKNKMIMWISLYILIYFNLKIKLFDIKE